MDLKTLRTVVREEGGKVFLVGEDDAPLVVLSLAEYQELKRGSGPERREGMEEGLRLEDLPV